MIAVQDLHVSLNTLEAALLLIAVLHNCSLAETMFPSKSFFENMGTCSYLSCEQAQKYDSI